MSQVPESKLGSVSIFSALAPPALARLAEVAERVEYPGNVEVVIEGTEGEALYVIDEGSAAVLKDPSKMVAMLGPGDHFGEMSLVDSAPCSASVVTREPCVMWRISRSNFELLLASSPDQAVAVYRGVIAVLCARLRSANENLSVLMGAVP